MKKLFFIVLLGFFGSTWSQEIQERNTDKLLEKGLEHYRNGDFSLALKYSQRGLELAPDYHDIRLLRVRSLQNLKRVDAASVDLFYLAEKAPAYPGVFSLVERQAELLKEEEKALEFLKKMIPYYPRKASLKLKKAQFHLEDNDFRKARTLAEEVNAMEEISDSESYLLHQLLDKTVKHALGFTFRITEFSEDYGGRDPWNTFQLEYQYNIRSTSLLARVTYAERSFDHGVLYELESYPVFNDKLYMFTHLGFSRGEIFPDLRTNASLYYNFAEGFEVEAGIRLMMNGGNEYFTGLAGLSSYLGSFYLNLRAGVGPYRSGNLVQNYQLNVRYYYKGANNYLYARLSEGIFPDETAIVEINENPELQAQFANVGIQFQLGYHHLLGLHTGLLFEEITSTRSGKQILGGIRYGYRF